MDVRFLLGLMSAGALFRLKEHDETLLFLFLQHREREFSCDFVSGVLCLTTTYIFL